MQTNTMKNPGSKSKLMKHVRTGKYTVVVVFVGNKEFSEAVGDLSTCMYGEPILTCMYTEPRECSREQIKINEAYIQARHQKRQIYLSEISSYFHIM